MESNAASLFYEELLNTFKILLDRALSGAVLPPSPVMSDIALTFSLLDITHAVRSMRPTQDLVERARKAFATYALQREQSRLPSFEFAV